MDGGKIGGEVFEISANIDDMTGEDLGAAMDILLGAGALDVWFEHIQMKKNRPAVKLSLLARPGDEERLAEAVLRHTTTLGVRMSKSSRVTLARDGYGRDRIWRSADEEGAAGRRSDQGDAGIRGC